MRDVSASMSILPKGAAALSGLLLATMVERDSAVAERDAGCSCDDGAGCGSA